MRPGRYPYFGAALLFPLALSCGGRTNETNASGHDQARPASCPATAPAPNPLPGVSARHLTLAFWLGRAREYGELDQALLTPEDIAAHNRALATDEENGLPIDRASLAAPPPRELLARELNERLTFLREHIASGEYVDAAGARVPPSTLADAPLAIRDELRIAIAPIALRCGPRRDGLFKQPIDPAFDRNNCSTIHAQEPVQVLMRWPNGMLLARTRYSLGWIAGDAALSPPVPPTQKEIVLSGAPMRARSGARVAASDGARLTAEEDLLLPSDGSRVLFADARGMHAAPPTGLLPTARPLTRRALLEEAFRRLDHPYGWGGHDGGLDCSSFLMDVLATFGLELPRHSGRQAQSGSYAIDVGRAGEDEKAALIDAAARRGIVLLHFPGHIMLYLGRDDSGTPRVIHAFSEYMDPCEGAGDHETLRRVDRVTVTDLSLGRGSSRRSFLERIDRIVLLGRDPGTDLFGTVAPRRAAPVRMPAARACDDSMDVRIFVSPETPNERQPLRVLATSRRDLGPVELAFVAPDGTRSAPALHRLGGPPFTWWAQIDNPRGGRWTVALGDGANVAACERISVGTQRPRGRGVDPNVVWTPRLRWEPDTEALYSAFVEQLFDYPMDEDLTWPNLTVLLADRTRNVLFDHLSQNEEDRIRLRPDCADLPYFLRTYFAWKMRLPLGFRSCSRGRRGQVPQCGELQHPGTAHGQTNEVDAFRTFVQSHVKPAVTSGSGRTHPNDSDAALYPVPLTRETLPPGTVYADPYGHLLVIARWMPQTVDHYGILVGAEAQPDGTVGRRRFWRGTFLFTSDTTNAGAGFKAFRPVLYDRRSGGYTALENGRITAAAGYFPFSMQQYEGTTDDFYERMEALINPRALDPEEMQTSLLDALQESATRRIVSVSNGEEWFAQHSGSVIPMPQGGEIFLTTGAWEDFSTPSRDMRLLIAIDTVLGFPDVVQRSPARFGLNRQNVAAAVRQVRERQAAELARRTFTYRRSDAREQELTLGQLVARARAFEVSYNPNDCVEIRWGAPEGSDELASCRRRAPPEQRRRMEQYRRWFATRTRPIW